MYKSVYYKDSMYFSDCFKCKFTVFSWPVQSTHIAVKDTVIVWKPRAKQQC